MWHDASLGELVLVAEEFVAGTGQEHAADEYHK